MLANGNSASPQAQQSIEGVNTEPEEVKSEAMRASLQAAGKEAFSQLVEREPGAGGQLVTEKGNCLKTQSVWRTLEQKGERYLGSAVSKVRAAG